MKIATLVTIFGLLLASITVQAQRSSTNKEPQYVLFEGKPFQIGIERIVEAYAIQSSGFMTGDTSQCRARTQQGFQAEDGTFVLIEFMRSKISKSRGVLCWASKDVSKFEKPYKFTYRTIKTAQNGIVTYETISVLSAIDMPEFTVEQLKTPDLLSSSSPIAEYVRAALHKPSFSVQYGKSTSAQK
jgi:hypothetical protein